VARPPDGPDCRPLPLTIAATSTTITSATAARLDPPCRAVAKKVDTSIMTSSHHAEPPVHVTCSGVAAEMEQRSGIVRAAGVRKPRGRDLIEVRKACNHTLKALPTGFTVTAFEWV
jgi:hypothetical protein